MKWSANGQSSAFLAATRMISLSCENVRRILQNVPLGSGMKVLDVGCGSGELCFRLGSATSGISFVGLDSDDDFVCFARRRAAGSVGFPFETPSSANDYTFVCADGLSMPFEDNKFDAVVSHTYLTAISDWEQALLEMKRVCKPRGLVVSITSLTDNFYGTGFIGLFSGVENREQLTIIERFDEAYESLFPSMNLVGGIPPREVPRAFMRSGITGIHCTPLAHYFCLSDAQITDDDYLRHCALLKLIEMERIARMAAEPASRDLLSNEDLRLFEQLVDSRYDTLIRSANNNREWNWYGNASLLVCGRRP